MNTSEIILKLAYPAYFQTEKKSYYDISDKMQEFSEIPSAKRYVFPKEYIFEEMIVQAKRLMENNGDDLGIFYGELHAKYTWRINDISSYLDKAKQITSDRDKLNEIEKVIWEFGHNRFNLGNSSVYIRESWDNIGLKSGFFIDAKHHEIAFSLMKYHETMTCDLEHLEKFYETTKKLYSKLIQ